MKYRSAKQKRIEKLKALRRHLDSEKFRSLKPNRAFIEWYLEARYGSLTGSQKCVLDAKGEGGVDAIIQKDEIAVVFQMKYEEKPRLNPLKRDEFGAFERVANGILGKTSEVDYRTWLGKIRPESRGKIAYLYEKAQRDPSSVSFCFVTSHRYTLGLSSVVEVNDASNILALWDLYQEGFTPPAEQLMLRMESLGNFSSREQDGGGYTTYVGLADVKELRKAMHDIKNERLFAQNVRTELSNPINRSITETYEREPEKFWFGNNGIYIVCRKATAQGSQIELIYPSIINGSQTLHAIDRSSKNHSCRILVRILEMDLFNDQRFLGDIIRRTNTQNPMKSENLLAHDPFQLNIARYLDQFHIFYERREKEWKNEKKDFLTAYIPIQLKVVTQWLAVNAPGVGIGTARSRLKELFGSANYTKIVGDLDPHFKSKAYDTLTNCIWTGLLLQQIRRRIKSKEEKSHLKMSSLLLVKLLTEIIAENGQTNLVKNKLGRHQFGKKECPPVLKRALIGTLRLIEKSQKAHQERNPTIDFSNFFKSNQLTRLTYDKIRRTSEYRALKKTLVTGLGDIR